MFLCGLVGKLTSFPPLDGPGSGPFITGVACTGLESSLYGCVHDADVRYNCPHSKIWRVICEGNLVSIHVVLCSLVYTVCTKPNCYLVLLKLLSLEVSIT